jgi:drug/metabolite transporter (DMT)-like permease
MSNKLNVNTIKWLILVFLSLIWGSSFILIKRGLDAFNGYQVGAIRIAITFLFLLPFAIPKLKSINKQDWKYIIQVNFIGNGIPAILYGVAQTKIESSVAGILNALTPLFALLISVFFFKAKLKLFNTLGVILGLIGAIGILSVGGIHDFNDKICYAMLIIIATIFYAYNINLIKMKLQNMNTLTIASTAFFIIGIPAIIYLFSTDFIHVLKTNNKAIISLEYLAILSIFGSGLALIAYYYLLKITNVIYTSSVTYIIPVIAILWGIADYEKFSLLHLVYIFIILIGIFLTNIEK